MADPSPRDTNSHNLSYLRTSPTSSATVPEPTEALADRAPERSINPQLNWSAEALGRGMGNAVASVKSLPLQFERLRSKIHLVHSENDSLLTSSGEVVGEWRDAVESSVAEAAETAIKYRSVLAEVASRRMQELRWRGERRYFAVRRDLHYRLDKLRRLSSEEPLQFIAGCAGAAFVLGLALRIWRSSHE